MLERFVRERLAEDRRDGFSSPERLAHVNLMISEKTGAKLSICCEAHSVAARAVGVSHRRDDSD
jgi:hypothetical protein